MTAAESLNYAKRYHDSEFLAHADELARTLYDHVAAAGGSISAEHGLGTAKRDAAAVYKSAVELDIMRAVKAGLDPHGLMNPGKVLSSPASSKASPSVSTDFVCPIGVQWPA